MKNDLDKIIKDHIAKNSKIVVAFSGGPDSVYLLYKLIELNHCKIVLAHFNHKLRGKDSDLDEEFAKETAKKLKLEFESDYLDIKKYAKENSLNLEEAARIKRYEFLNKIKQKHKAKYIVTAHHADDNLETFLLNFIRGAGLNGLKSMQIINNNIFRPLLYTSKEEINDYLRKNKIKFRVDKSNNDNSFTRNKLRNEIIPKLREIQPDLINISIRNLKNFNEIHELIKNRANKDVLTKQILLSIYKNVYGSTKNLSTSQLEKLLKLSKNKKTGKKAEFGKNFFLTSTTKSLELIPKNNPISIKKKKIKIPGKTSYEFGEIECILTNQVPKRGLFLEYSKLKLPLYIRSKVDGDRFRPFGLKGTKKLQDFFTDNKIPKHKRSQIPVITDKKGKIVAIGNFTIDDNYKILKSNKEKANQYLEILLKKDKL
jgi:tRNA(Ile)-lysidine synthase